MTQRSKTLDDPTLTLWRLLSGHLELHASLYLLLLFIPLRKLCRKPVHLHCIHGFLVIQRCFAAFSVLLLSLGRQPVRYITHFVIHTRGVNESLIDCILLLLSVPVKFVFGEQGVSFNAGLKAAERLRMDNKMREEQFLRSLA